MIQQNPILPINIKSLQPSLLNVNCQRRSCLNVKSNSSHCKSQSVYQTLYKNVQQGVISNHQYKIASDEQQFNNNNPNLMGTKQGIALSELKRQLQEQLIRSNVSLSSTKPNNSTPNQSRVQGGSGVISKFTPSRTSSSHSIVPIFGRNRMASESLDKNSTFVVVDYSHEMQISDEIMDASHLQSEEFFQSKKIGSPMSKSSYPVKQMVTSFTKQLQTRPQSPQKLSPDIKSRQQIAQPSSLTSRVSSANIMRRQFSKTNNWTDRKTSQNDRQYSPIKFNNKEGEISGLSSRIESPEGQRRMSFFSKEAEIKENFQSTGPKKGMINNAQEERMQSGRSFLRKGSLQSVAEETIQDSTKNVQSQMLMNQTLMNKNLETNTLNKMLRPQSGVRSNNLNPYISATQSSRGTLSVTQSKKNLRREKSILQDIQEQKIDLESIKVVMNILEYRKQEILNLIQDFNSGNIRLEEIIWEILFKCIESKSLKLLCRVLMFIGQIQLSVGNIDKTAFFYNQSRLCCELISNSSELKSRLYSLLGELAIFMNISHQSIKFYKKSLQYAWYNRNVNQEIEVYDSLGIAYYYLHDLQKSDFYHQRSVNSDFEVVNSHLMRVSNEVTADYIKQREHILDVIDSRVFSHLALPFNFSKFDHIFQPAQKKAQGNFLGIKTQQSQLNFQTNNSYEDIHEQQFDTPRVRDSFLSKQTPHRGSKRRETIKINKDSSVDRNSQSKISQLITARKSVISQKSIELGKRNGAATPINQSFEQNDKIIAQINSQNQIKQEDSKIKLPSESEEDLERLENCLQAYRAKLHLYNNCNAEKIMSGIIEEKEFEFEMSTPKHSIMKQNPMIAVLDRKKKEFIFKEGLTEEQEQDQHILDLKQGSSNRKIPSTGYDISKLGVVGTKSSERVFNDYKKYKLPVQKKIEVLNSQNLTLAGVWKKVERETALSKNYSNHFNDRIRLSQNTPNRCASNFQNYPKIAHRKIRSSLSKLISEIEAVIKQEMNETHNSTQINNFVQKNG